MRRFFFGLAIGLCLATGLLPQAIAGKQDIPRAIESFMHQHYPLAASYTWIINETVREKDEVTLVDLLTIVTPKVGPGPREERFLLLIVQGQLAGSQSVPIDSPTLCGEEQI